MGTLMSLDGLGRLVHGQPPAETERSTDWPLTRLGVCLAVALNALGLLLWGYVNTSFGLCR